MTDTTTRQTCTVNQAQRIAGVSRRTIYNWIRDGKIELLRTAGGQPRIYVDTLFRWDDGTVRPVTAPVPKQVPMGDEKPFLAGKV